MNNQPITIANVTATSRSQVLNLNGALGYEVGNERTSLNNYFTMLRAVNPTRRMAVPGLNHSLMDKVTRSIPTGLPDPNRPNRVLQRDVSEETKQLLVAGRWVPPTEGHSGWDASLALVLPCIASLNPAVSDSIVLESLMTEERIATAGGVKDQLLDEVLRSKTALPLAWHRFFRTAAPHLVDVPVSAILDPITKGSFTNGKSTSGVKASSTSVKGYTHMAYFAESAGPGALGESSLTQALARITEGTGEDGFTQFYNQCLAADFLHAMPRLTTLFAAETMNLVTKDPEQRFHAMVRTAKLIRFMSLQPAMFYAACLHHLLTQPQVREDISRIHENFYASDTWKAFAGRAEQIRLGHVYRHIYSDVTSSMATTRYGDTQVLRAPQMIAPMLENWNIITKSAALTGSASGTPAATPVRGAKSDFTLVDPSYFMRHFLRATGPDEVWSPLASEFTAALGYEAPVAAPAVNYLDPPVIMSDGWSSSAPVDYASATRSIVITPMTFRTGGPSKTALTLVPSLSKEDIALESNVASVQTVQRTLTPEQRDKLSTEGMSALGTDRPCLWIMRHAETHSLYANETFVSLNGRMPLAMWNGDLDATIVPHTTFEDFAMDLGMSPEGLASLYSDSVKGGAAFAVSQRVQAFVRLFFADRAPDDTEPSIFSTSDNYGMGTVKFRSHAYYISARAAVMQTASLVGLAPIWATERLTLVTREFSNAVYRQTVAFRTVTSEPLQPKEHAAALRDVVRLDEAIAAAWGANLATPSMR